MNAPSDEIYEKSTQRTFSYC